MVNDDNNQSALYSFIDDLLTEVNTNEVSPEDLPQLKALLMLELQEVINVHLVSKLSENDQQELEKMLDRDAPAKELDQFFTQKIPNLEGEIMIALLSFRSAFLSSNLSEGK